MSGIEPVDELLGGLERGKLYLVHGEASGRSLFGIKFLIEGLKRNENGALVIRYSPEDAVRRFARVGYDCLEDVYSGRLVILEYSDDIIQKIGKLRELTPVLRELEWLLGETHPKRLVFDPVTSVLSGTEGSIEARAIEFSGWARSFGATVVLTANESNQEVIQSFKPQVSESFRFDLRESGDRAGRYIAFEKSLTISDQAIEVDPSRGVFLLGRPDEVIVPHPPSIAELELIRDELRSARQDARKQEAEPFGEIDLVGEAPAGTAPIERAPDTGELVPAGQHREDLQTRKLTSLEELESRTPLVARPPESTRLDELELPFETPPARPEPRPASEGPLDELSSLLDDLTGTATPLDLDFPEFPAVAQPSVKAPARSELPRQSLAGQPKDTTRSTPPEAPSREVSRKAKPGAPDETERPIPRHVRASDLRIDSARAAELLLRPPDASTEFRASEVRPPRTQEQRETATPIGEGEVRARDFSVLIIEDDPETCDLVTQTLGDYTLEVVHDGVSALAKLISFKADLVVLDFDLPVIDGFKVLTLIRTSLNVPIIIISGSRMRAIDRVMSSELGADYYLTKPFSPKELKHKARQLIARYRGISSWIISAPPASEARSPAPDSEAAAPYSEPVREPFTAYEEFASEVEKRVKAAMEGGAAFSIVGCRLPRMTANGGKVALRLFDIIQSLVREADLMSTNSRNDLVVLLADAGKSGARAFAGRLRERVMEGLNQEPSLWMRSFPELEESTEAAAPAPTQTEEGVPSRRASDRSILAQAQAGQTTARRGDRSSTKSDPRESYIDLPEHL
ncbi:MAG TPA: response regulator [Blastocatellia bacterium]|nr:response regulator [Blastocatellia bacterium]